MKKKYLGFILFAIVSFVILNTKVNAMNIWYNSNGDWYWARSNNGTGIYVSSPEYGTYNGKTVEMYCVSPKKNAARSVNVKKITTSTSCNDNKKHSSCSMIYILKSNYSWKTKLLAARLLAKSYNILDGDGIYNNGNNGIYGCSLKRINGKGNGCTPYWQNNDIYKNAVKLYKASNKKSKDLNLTPSSNNGKIYTLHQAYPSNSSYQKYYFITEEKSKTCSTYKNKKIKGYTYNGKKANTYLGINPSESTIKKSCFVKNKTCSTYKNKKISGYTYDSSKANKDLGANPSESTIKKTCFKKKKTVKKVTCATYKSKKIDGYIYDPSKANTNLGTNPSNDKIKKTCFVKTESACRSYNEKTGWYTDNTKNGYLSGYTYKGPDSKKVNYEDLNKINSLAKGTLKNLTASTTFKKFIAEDNITEVTINNGKITGGVTTKIVGQYQRYLIRKSCYVKEKKPISCDTATEDFNSNINKCSEYTNGFNSFISGEKNGTTEAYNNLKKCNKDLADAYKNACIKCDCSDPDSPWDSCDQGSGDQSNGNDACEKLPDGPEKDKCNLVCPTAVKATCAIGDKDCFKDSSQKANNKEEDLNKSKVKIDLASSIKPSDLKSNTLDESAYENYHVKKNSNDYCDVYCVDNIEGISFPTNRNDATINNNTYLSFGLNYHNKDNRTFIKQVRYCFSVIKNAEGLKTATDSERNACLKPAGSDEYGKEALAQVSLDYERPKEDKKSDYSDFEKTEDEVETSQYSITDGTVSLNEITYTPTEVNINNINNDTYIVGKYVVVQAYEPKTKYCVSVSGKITKAENGKCNDGSSLLGKYGNVIPFDKERYMGEFKYNISVKAKFIYGQSAVDENKDCNLNHNCQYKLGETSCKIEGGEIVEDDDIIVKEGYLTPANASFMPMSVNNILTNEVVPVNFSTKAGKEAIKTLQEQGEDTYNDDKNLLYIDLSKCDLSKIDIKEYEGKYNNNSIAVDDQSGIEDNASSSANHTWYSEFISELLSTNACEEGAISGTIKEERNVNVSYYSDGSYLIK